jgi:hypothetical protein
VTRAHRLVVVAVLAATLAGGGTGLHLLAIASGNDLRVVDADSAGEMAVLDLHPNLTIRCIR